MNRVQVLRRVKNYIKSFPIGSIYNLHLVSRSKLFKATHIVYETDMTFHVVDFQGYESHIGKLGSGNVWSNEINLFGTGSWYDRREV